MNSVIRTRCYRWHQHDLRLYDYSSLAQYFSPTSNQKYVLGLWRNSAMKNPQHHKPWLLNHIVVWTIPCRVMIHTVWSTWSTDPFLDFSWLERNLVLNSPNWRKDLDMRNWLISKWGKYKTEMYALLKIRISRIFAKNLFHFLKAWPFSKQNFRRFYRVLKGWS